MPGPHPGLLPARWAGGQVSAGPARGPRSLSCTQELARRAQTPAHPGGKGGQRCGPGCAFTTIVLAHHDSRKQPPRCAPLLPAFSRKPGAPAPSQGQPACGGLCLRHGSSLPRSRGVPALMGVGGHREGTVRTRQVPPHDLTDIKTSHPVAASEEGPAAAVGGGRQGPHPQGAGPSPLGT